MFNKFLVFRTRSTIILLLFLVAAAPLLSCASPAPAQAPGGGSAVADTTIEVWHGWSGAAAQAFEAAVDQFMVKNPEYEVLLTHVPSIDLRAKLSTALAAGAGPDVFMLPPAEVGDYVDGDLLLAFDEGTLDASAKNRAVRHGGSVFGLSAQGLSHPVFVVDGQTDVPGGAVEFVVFITGKDGDSWIASVPVLAWLAAHNRYRCMHGAPALEWSPDLEKVASWRVNNCGQCEHCLCQGASCQPLFSGQYAENATCWGAGPQEAVDAWYSEEANYDYDNPVWGQDTGHFINVVASSGQKVGCACNASHCYCDYDAQYGTTASALKQVVSKPVKTAAECGQ